MFVSILNSNNNISRSCKKKILNNIHFRKNLKVDTFEYQKNVSFASSVQNLLFDEVKEHIENGDMDSVKKLPNLSIINNDLDTLLHISAGAKQLEISRFLLEKGLNKDQKNKNQLTPFAIACSKKDENLVKLFLQYNPDTNTQDKNGNTPLHKGCSSEKIMKLLLDNGANPYIKNKSGSPVLFEAASNQHFLEFLLKAGVNPNSMNDQERSLLHIAAITNAKKLAELLLKYKAEINFKDKFGKTPIFYAAQNNIFRFLLEKNPNLDITDKTGKTVLHQTVNNNDFIKVYDLLEHKANPNISDKDGKTPLFCATNNQMRKLLLIFGADPNVKLDNDVTLLHIAVQQNDLEAVKMLLEYKADANILNKENRAPLGYAKTNEMRKLLLQNGANPNEKLYLHMALITQNNEFFEDLMQSKADVNAENAKGRTPLFYCKTDAQIEILVKNKINLNHQDLEGNSALHIFAANGNKEIIGKLIQLGANTQLTNKKGQTYRDIYKKYKNYDCWVKKSQKGTCNDDS